MVNRIVCSFCGKCLDVCPLFELTKKEHYSPKSKLFLIDLFKNGCFSLKEVKALAGICVSCNRCHKVCPNNINVAEIIWELKGSYPSWKKWIWGKALSHFPVSLRLCELIPSVYSNFFKLDYKYLTWFYIKKAVKVLENNNVVIFLGCVGKHIKKDWHRKAKDLLIISGYNVLEHEFGCCSFPYMTAGLIKEARLMQDEILSKWKELGMPLIAVVCATCYFALKNVIPRSINDIEMRVAWENSLFFLWDMFEVLDYDVDDSYLNKKKICLHLPCHATENYWNFMDELLNSEKIERCCGFGGFMVLEDIRLIERFAIKFWENEIECHDVVTYCSGCVIQLNFKIPDDRMVYHILDSIDVVRLR